MMQSDANSADEILRQKHDAKIKRRKTARKRTRLQSAARERRRLT
jgi:hypothetical protein